MEELNLLPTIVGRDNELSKLQECLEHVKNGKGNTIFISGEAGIGKTRLVLELNQIAQTKGFQTLLGNSMFESLTPFMPFIEALRTRDLETLFSEEAPRVELVYLVTNSGLLIKEVVREETQLNPDLFAAMLTTVNNFVKESLSILTGEEKEGTLNTLGYQNYRILIESGQSANLAIIISGRENEFLINDMKEILIKVDEYYGVELKSWDGDDEKLKGLESLVEPLITSGKYDGIDYVKNDPKTKRNILFENVLLGIIRHTKVNPLLLCIEDLQWADQSTLALMHYIARNTRSCHLLILGTYRPEDVIKTKNGRVHHLVETMQLMSREDIYRNIELDRLKKGHIDEMLNSILGRTLFSDEFKEQIYRETEGNPFFIVSLIRMMVEEKTIEKKDNSWFLVKDLKEVNMPSKMHDVIERRLNRVKSDERKTLDYASVIGEEFTSTILTKALDINRIQLLEQLRTLEQNHKLIRSFDTKYRFDHAKIQEVLYDKIPTELRMEYHKLVADAIEAYNKNNLDEVVGDLALHYYHCRNAEKALPYLLKAAEKAMDQFSHHEAYEYYRYALEVIESEGDSLDNKKRKLKILMAIGDNCFTQGEWDDALSYYHRVIRLGEELVDEKSQAEGYRNIGLIHKNRNDWENAISFLNKGIKIAEKIKDNQVTAKLYYSLGSVSDEKGELSEARKYYGKCMELAVNIGNSSEIANAYLGIGRLHIRKGEYDQSIETFKKAIMILKNTKEFWELSKAYANLGATYNQLNDVDNGIKYLKKSIEIADKTRNVRIKGYSLMNTAYSLIEKNDLKTAFSYLDKALEIFKKLGERLPISIAYENYGSIYRRQKQWDKAIDYFEKSLKISRDLGALYNIGDVLLEYGLMYKDKGDLVEANEQLTKALDIFKNLRNNKMIEKVQNEISILQQNFKVMAPK